MKRFEIGFLLLVLSIAGCSGVKEHAASAKSPGNSSGAGTGTTTTSPSRLCSLFTTAEIKDVLGAPVTDGKVAGPLDSACQWDGISAGDDADLRSNSIDQRHPLLGEAQRSEGLRSSSWHRQGGFRRYVARRLGSGYGYRQSGAFCVFEWRLSES